MNSKTTYYKHWVWDYKQLRNIRGRENGILQQQVIKDTTRNRRVRVFKKFRGDFRGNRGGVK